jgi:lipopolysaccharide export system protein LptA
MNTRRAIALIILAGLAPPLAGIDAARAQQTQDQAQNPPQAKGSQGLSTGFRRDSDQPINFAADTMEVAQDAKTATLTGNVQIAQGELRLKGDTVIIHYRQREGAQPQASADPATPTGGGASEISRMEAKGKVFISSPTETAQGDWADYDVVSGLVKMGGAVVLTRGPNVLKGNALALDLNSGRSRLTAAPGATGSGRVQGLFVPQKKDKNGDTKPAP